MAKGGGTMNDYRRQERKKELLKTKKERIAARDERVKANKTIKEVQDAIYRLEKRSKRNAGEEQKLQRLQKELKLVQQAAKERAAAANKTAFVAAQRPLTELDDPRKSVYYDKQLNPYGAPPPGKPRLYHSRFGGTTMKLQDAIVPGLAPEEQQVDDEPEANLVERERLLKQRQRQEQQPQKQQESRQRYDEHDYRSKRHQQQPPPPPPPPPLPKEQPPPPNSAPPKLPPPSQSVKRASKKRKLAADIWASTDEISYEKHVHGIDLETGDADGQWYYKDNFQKLQGPFGLAEMQSWCRGGFFPPSTCVKRGRKAKFVQMSRVDWTTGKIKDDDDKPVDKKEEAEQDADGVQARIQALRQEERPEAAAQQDNEKEEDGVNARIEALRQERASADSDHDVQARIEALRQAREESEADMAVAPPIAKADALVASDEVPVGQDDKDNEAPCGQADATPDKEPVATPSDANMQEGPPAYPVHQVEEPPSYPAVAAYPVDEEQQPPPPAYPVGAGLPAYPVVGADEEPPAYPVDEIYPSDLAYPVTDAYPTENGGGAHYPDDNGNVAAANPESKSDSTPAAARPKVDKDVIAFMPSHLQKRRKTPSKPIPKGAPPSANKAKATKSVAEDYDKFMEEISDLK